MRITHLRFKNLNALVGEWSIDLTDPAYISEGLFVITGPTGAGKSTVLDAVCLALYGRTPRLRHISQTVNEIMSRHTSECWAEVDFETTKGAFRCRWSQRRAGNRAHGNLQAPQHELSDMEEGTLLGKGLRATSTQVETLTGMTFDRFTRAILLAQGGFAAFLHANTAERSALLEQITGTELYSEISKHAYIRAVAAQKSLDDCRKELNIVQLLSEEERVATHEKLEQILIRDTAFAEALQKLRTQAAWLHEEMRLQTLEQENRTRLHEWEERNQRFATDRHALEQASRALLVEGVYSTVLALREAQANTTKQLIEEKNALPIAEHACCVAEAAEKDALSALEKEKSCQENAEPYIQQIQELDVRLTEKETQAQTLNNLLIVTQRRQKELIEQQQRHEKTVKETEFKLNGLSQALHDRAVDALLDDALPLIQSRVDALCVLHDDRQRLTKEDTLLQNQRDATAKDLRTVLLEAKVVKKHIIDVTQRVVETEKQLNSVLQERELRSWREQVEQQRNTVNAALRLLDMLRSHERVVVQHTTCLQKIHKNQEQITLVNETLSRAQERHEYVAKEEMLCAEHVALHERIAGLEAQRHLLQDGLPCPLCGSVEHPFIIHKPLPQLEHARRQWLDAQEKTRRILAECHELKKTEAALQHEQRLHEETRQQLVNDIVRQKEEIRQLAQPLALKEHETALQSVESFCVAEQERFNLVQKHLIRLEELVQRVNAQRTTLNTERATEANILLLIERNKQELRHENKESLRLRDELNALEKRELVVCEHLVALSAPFVSLSLQTLTPSVAKGCLHGLEERKRLWQETKQEYILQEKKILECKAQTDEHAARCMAVQSEIIRCSAELKQIHSELTALHDTRKILCHTLTALIGTLFQSIDSCKLFFKTRLSEQENKYSAAHTHYVQTIQQNNNLQKRLHELEQEYAQRAVLLQSREKSCLQAFYDVHFVDEQAFLNARMTQERFTALQLHTQQLDQERVVILANKQEYSEQREKLQQRKPQTDDLGTDIANKQAILESERTELLQELGVLRQKLFLDEQHRQQHQQHLAALDALQQEAQRWANLCELIGSANGQKFCAFAQGLTFECVVAHANRALHGMTDRYVLQRELNEPLSLNVVDAYQGGVARSTKNLSGGESFLVSLALALGLSRMSSRTVRVDSLFLDEGFGTLDEDSLETALHTLSDLRHEGKMIGVISHVQGLKSRISTQISVEPLEGGRSRLRGPGCIQH